VRVSAGDRGGVYTARRQSTAQICMYIGRKLFLVILNLNYLPRTGGEHNFMLISVFCSE
jgi:hypothetical protein